MILRWPWWHVDSGRNKEAEQLFSPFNEACRSSGSVQKDPEDRSPGHGGRQLTMFGVVYL